MAREGLAAVMRSPVPSKGTFALTNANAAFARSNRIAGRFGLPSGKNRVPLSLR